ncbi:phosphonate C-P lyase system protein PhnG [Roseovarius sp. TE539]|uniref:phosphonate C-P lyase system protein PhnG n=1 Tax=Roseovarius sp. TE539 TaxID=2249812 RepID=UPI000DDE34EC|nr:phosphonate C-P lyase system protein PhnG [Roseovarius sp. TE539]RBI68336.1 phosphonate C-P lyase system protein PhnG [Roseovarius sp. TE539]
MTDSTARQTWMGLLARVPARTLEEKWDEFGLEPEYTVLRQPEIGGVMVRGRAGATGAAFNIGEMTVTRCSLRLPDGEVGHGYVQGRDKSHALRAALVDALMQTDIAETLQRDLLKPLREGLEAARANRAAKAAATKVDFFTMARGED